MKIYLNKNNLLVSILALIGTGVQASPNGAPHCAINPDGIAKGMSGEKNQQLGFSLDCGSGIYTPGKPLEIKLKGTAQSYKGLLIYIEGPDTKSRAGSFVVPSDFKSQKNICDDEGFKGSLNAVLTHKTSAAKPTGTVFNWTPDNNLCTDLTARAVVVGKGPSEWQVLPPVPLKCSGKESDSSKKTSSPDLKLPKASGKPEVEVEGAKGIVKPKFGEETTNLNQDKLQKDTSKEKAKVDLDSNKGTKDEILNNETKAEKEVQELDSGVDNEEEEESDYEDEEELDTGVDDEKEEAEKESDYEDEEELDTGVDNEEEKVEEESDYEDEEELDTGVDEEEEKVEEESDYEDDELDTGVDNEEEEEELDTGVDEEEEEEVEKKSDYEDEEELDTGVDDEEETTEIENKPNKAQPPLDEVEMKTPKNGIKPCDKNKTRNVSIDVKCNCKK